MLSGRDVFVSVQRRVLLNRLFYPWRRRGATLLQVGLACGPQPDFFWEAGFDASALDADPALLEQVRAECGPRVDFHLGQPDHLPFDEGSYDYVVVAHCKLSAPMLAEAMRVAMRGVIVLEWNRFSLAATRLDKSLPWVWPWQTVWMMRREYPQITARMLSILPLPVCTWPADLPVEEAMARTTPPQRSFMYRLHSKVFPLPLGALLGIRLDKEPLSVAPTGVLTEALRAAARAPDTAGASPRVVTPQPVQECTGPKGHTP